MTYCYICRSNFSFSEIIEEDMERTRNSVMHQIRILYPNKNWAHPGNLDRDNRFYNSCFNMTLDQITALVMRIKWVWGEGIDRMWNIKHLLWTLVYLKRYPTYDQLQCDIGPDKKTLKKWILYTIDLISEIGMVCFV